ncbi:hypothetical protein [Rahnella bonaserana]|jgi:hypothetical protein
MAWSNVDSLSAVKVWLQDSTETYPATLFGNQRHQVAVCIGVSFIYIDECGEKLTSEEVRQAITLIDNTDGGSLKSVVDSPKGEYANWYNTSLSLSKSAHNESNYEFEFTCYLSSLGTEETQEGVAVKLTFVDGYGQSFDYDTSSHGSGGIKTFVTIDIIPSKRYGVEGSGFTAVTMTADAGDPDFSSFQNILQNSSQDYGISRMKIASDYFYFQDITDDYNSDLRQPNYIYFENDNDHLYNTYCLTSSEKYAAEQYVYTNFMSNGIKDGNIPAFLFSGEVNQVSDEVVFLNISAKIESMSASTNRNEPMNFIAHDQFGNSIGVYVVFNGAALVSNVTY